MVEFDNCDFIIICYETRPPHVVKDYIVYSDRDKDGRDRGCGGDDPGAAGRPVRGRAVETGGLLLHPGRGPGERAVGGGLLRTKV
jgi:hypothetical protein